MSDTIPEPDGYDHDGEPFWETETGTLAHLAPTEGGGYVLTDSEEEFEFESPAYTYDHGATEEEVLASIEHHRENVASQRVELEHDLSRKLTPREVTNLASELAGQLERGEEIDLYSAHVQHGEHYDLDKDADRVKYMSDQLAGTGPEPVKPLADDASEAERVAWMTARVSGAPIADVEE